MKKHLIFWPLLLVLVFADCTTKRLAVEHLGPAHVPHEVVGDVVRFSLGYNPGIAFGIHIGEHSRWAFTTLALVVLAALLHLYRRTSPTEQGQVTGLAMVTAGAVGNLIDRVRWSRGVVDFIDIGVGTMRFWTFNLADVCVTTGAVLLALGYLKYNSR